MTRQACAVCGATDTMLIGPAGECAPGEGCAKEQGPDPRDCDRFARSCANCGRGFAHDEPCPPAPDVDSLPSINPDLDF